jgi:hypothetical protein
LVPFLIVANVRHFEIILFFPASSFSKLGYLWYFFSEKDALLSFIFRLRILKYPFSLVSTSW